MTLAIRLVFVGIGIRCLVGGMVGFRAAPTAPGRRLRALASWAESRPSLLFSSAEQRDVRALALLGAGNVEAATGAALVLRVACLVGSAILGGLLIDRAGPQYWVIGALLVGAGVGVPRWTAAVRLRSIRRRAESDIPAFVELLAAGLSVSVGPTSALGFAAVAAPATLRSVVARAHQRALLGHPPAASLRTEAEAVGLSSLAASARAVERDLALGLPCAHRLRSMADELRGSADAARVERAGRVVPLATLVSAMVIAPACVVVLAVLVIGGGIIGAPGFSPI